MRLLFHALSALTVLAVALPLGWWGMVQATDGPVEGVAIDAEAASGDATLRAHLEERARHWLETEVTIESGGVSHRLSRRDLGAHVDVDAVMERARRVGRSGNPMTDLADLIRARRHGIDVSWEPAVDEAALTAAATRIGEASARVATAGVLDLDERIAVRPTPGARLDPAVAAEALRTLLASNDRSLKIGAETIPPSEGVPVPKGLRLDQVVGRYETTFHRYGDYIGRAHNVRLAASRLHGAILPPRGALSFNEQVGERRARAGYRMAPVIIRGELAEDVGGGVCQVASTLHAAAFYGGLEPVEYVPHSRPSSYIPMGLDATVVWPEVDLRIRNPYDFPIAVRSTVEENRLTVELLGARAPADVEWARDFVDTRSFTNRVVVDPSLAPGARVVSQGGIRGFTVRRVRRIREGDRYRVEDRIIDYPPTDHIVRVGPGG